MNDDLRIWEIADAEANRMAGEINALRAELDAAKDNSPSDDALDMLWNEIILANHGNECGDWEYPGQAYSHIKAEYDETKTELDEMKSQRDALVGLCVNFLEVTAPNEPRNDDLLRAWEAMDSFIQDIEGTQS